MDDVFDKYQIFNGDTLIAVLDITPYGIFKYLLKNEIDVNQQIVVKTKSGIEFGEMDLSDVIFKNVLDVVSK